MDALDNNSMPLSEHSSSSTYNLNLESGSEMVTPSGDLVSLGDAGDGDLSEDTTKELPLLIIQERLEESASVAEPESVQEAMKEDLKTVVEEVSGCIEEAALGLTEDNEASDCQKLVIVNDYEEAQNAHIGDEQQNGYLVYSPTDNTLRVASSKLTPLLMVANNAEKGMYEANVVFGQNGNRNARLQESQVLPEPETSVAADKTTITMTVDGNTQLILGKQHTDGQLLYIYGVDKNGAALQSLDDSQEHQTYHASSVNGAYQDNDHQGSNNKTLICPHEGCNRTFSWPTHLKYHELTHTGKRMFKCEVEGCGMRFYTIQHLTVHQRTHTGERPFVCAEPNCGKAFTTQGNLKNHSRIHSGERPFACETPGCSRRFAEHSSLRKHMLVHTGSKPYMCELCGKRFSQSGSRNVHMKRHQAAIDAAGQQIEKETIESSSAGVMVKLPNDKVIILQGTQGQLLQGYGEMTAGDSVIYSNAVTDHVVTVTTMPAEDDADSLRISQDQVKHEDQAQSQLSGSTGANVVVLSQPEEMVAMAPGYHHDGEEPSKDMVYACHQLLNSDVS